MPVPVFFIEKLSANLRPIQAPGRGIPAMSNLTVKYARNGALASLGLYFVVVMVVLAVSFGYERGRIGASPVDASMTFYQQLSQSIPVLLTSQKKPSGRQQG
ncbi:hypothetical protein D3C76_1229340 [compost metagenome]|jgi:hypothetical protein